MALFTDFFPTAGDQIASNNQMPVASGNATVSNLMDASLTLTFNPVLTAGVINIGDIVSMVQSGTTYAGVVTGITTDGEVYELAIAYTVGLNEAAVDASVSREGQTIIEGDIVAGGNTHIAGDTTVSGDTTLRGDTQIVQTLDLDGDFDHDGTNFNTAASSVIIGGATSTTDINGSTVTIGETGGTTTIADSLTVSAGGITVTGDSSFANTLLVTGNLDLEGTQLDLTTIPADHGLGLDTEGIVRRTSKTNFGTASGEVATWAEGNNTATIPAEKLPNLVFGEVHTLILPDGSTTDPGGVPTLTDLITFLNGISAGDMYADDTASEGDTFVVIGTLDGTLDANAGDGSTVTFIYTGTTDKAFTATDFVATNFHQIAGAGAGVTSLSVATGSSLVIDGSTGDLTLDINLDTATGSILYDDGTTGFAASNITQAAGGALTLGAATTISGNTSIDGTNTFTVGTGATALGGTLAVTGNTTVAGTFGVTGTGASTLGGTLSVTGATTLADNLTVNGEAITLGDGTDGTVTLNGATLDLNGALDFDGAEFVVTTTDTDSASIDINSAGGVDVDASGVINLDSSSTSTTAVVLTASAHATNDATLTLSGAGGATLEGTGLALTGHTADVAISSQTNTTISATGEFRIAGTGISTSASDMEPMALVVGADGHVMTSAQSGGVAFDAVELTAGGTAVAGDLYVLHRIATDQTLTLPTSPMSGDFIEIANLSGYPAIAEITYVGNAGMDAMNTGIWQIEPGTQRILGQEVTGTFGLNDATASFKLIFISANVGWVIIGAN